MSKLSQQQKDLLYLYARSPQDSEGWAVVSDMLLPVVTKFARQDILELSGNRIRATEAGKVLLAYGI